MACVDDGGCSHTPSNIVITLTQDVALGPDHPVIFVNFFDIQEYIAWLIGKVGQEVYRLPTEADWEYAARAGTETRFAQGDELTSQQAVFSKGATEHIRGMAMPDLIERDFPLPVAELDAANGWGLLHMSGNVDEWTMTCSSKTHLGLASATEYLRTVHGMCSERNGRLISKAGAFTRAMDGVRVAGRSHPKPSSRFNDRGFRLVRDVQ